MYADKLYGTLAVETDEYRNFTDEEMNLLMALAAQAGLALRNAQLFETVQNTNQQLEGALTALQASQVEIERAHAAEIAAYESEMETARAIQNSLLPQEKPPISQVQLAARNIPARHVSGDFYQYLLMPDGKLGIAVGDVSGKGMPAALLMAVTTTALRDEITRAGTASGILNGLNERLLARMKQTNMNSALTMAIFDPATHTVEIANAGMVQPYIRTEMGWEAITVGGYPLGASARANYSFKQRTLTPGATMVFISDGVIESQSPTGEFYGFERFEALLAKLPADATPDNIIETVLHAVYQHLSGQEPQDDITVVVLQAIPERVGAFA
jgi:serine phosphatase RsbU (regulator of sigma subunit)